MYRRVQIVLIKLHHDHIFQTMNPREEFDFKLDFSNLRIETIEKESLENFGNLKFVKIVHWKEKGKIPNFILNDICTRILLLLFNTLLV